MLLIKQIEDLSLEPYIENKYRCIFFDWFLENLYFKKDHSKYSTLWTVKQESTYILWEIICKFLINNNHKKLMSYKTRFMLFTDMKRWLIKTIKMHYIEGLDSS